MTGTTQRQVADIITGRRARVRVYDVLARIAQGVSIPPGTHRSDLLGIGRYVVRVTDAYPDGVTVANTPKGGC
ncbi:MAG: hypothetical protein ACRDSL_13010 [Pseudonocardiaceae bacterium]